MKRCSEALDANDGGAFGDFELRSGIRQLSDRQLGAFRKPDVVTSPKLNFGARPASGVYLIASKQRQVLDGRGPFSDARAKEGNVALNETQSRHSRNRRRVIDVR